MNRLQACFTTTFGIAPEEVTDALAYQSIPQWDSVGHMALVAELETQFGIMLDTEDIIGMSTVAKAREIVHKHGADPNG